MDNFSSGLHKRVSIGGTIKASQADAFFNIYRGLSDPIQGFKISDGYDIGINTVISGLESINLGATKYHFNEDNSGSKYKVEYRPNSLITFGLELKNPEGTGIKERNVYLETKYKFDTPFDEQLRPITKISKNVWNKRYDEVERSNTIALELESEPKLVTLEFTDPAPVSWEGAEVAPVIPTDYIEGAMGELSYKITGDLKNTQAKVNDENKIVEAQGPGTIEVTVSMAPGQYLGGVVGKYTVTFTNQDAKKEDFAEQEVPWGTKSAAPDLSEYNEEEKGKITYTSTDPNNTGAKVNPVDGSVEWG